MKLPLRELFLLAALVAMGCGWWVERSRLQSQLQKVEVDLIFKEEECQELRSATESTLRSMAAELKP